MLLIISQFVFEKCRMQKEYASKCNSVSLWLADPCSHYVSSQILKLNGS